MVYVEWMDSFGRSGWAPLESLRAERPSKVVSVGFVLRENDEAVLIVQSLSDHDNGDNSIVIPKVAITKMRRVK